MSASDVPGVYGKIEAQADFFRANAGEFSQAGLDRWFEAASETMRGEGGRLPDAPTGFLLAPRTAARAFMGAFAPSGDAAGRSFPLAVFAPLDAIRLNGEWPLRVKRAVAFAAGAGVLASEGRRLRPADLVERAERLPHSGLSVPLVPVEPVDRSELSPFAEDGAAEQGAQSTDRLRSVFERSPPALAYALRTLTLACDQATKYGTDAVSGVITVDAPLSDWSVGAVWLELVARRLRWREGAPSMLWTAGDGGSPAGTGRLLITLGPLSSAAFGYLANPRHRSSRLWPLRTDVTPAIDQAWQALSVEQRGLLESPTVSTGELVEAFAS